MWGNGKKQKTTLIDTLVSAETEILGDIKFKGGLRIEGTVKGNVLAANEADAVLELDESGRVEGEVQIPNVRINGEVTGDIHAKHIELLEKARVRGSIYYQVIEMTSGAEVNGQLVQKNQQSQNVVDKVFPAAVNDDEVAPGLPAKH